MSLHYGRKYAKWKIKSLSHKTCFQMQRWANKKLNVFCNLLTYSMRETNAKHLLPIVCENIYVYLSREILKAQVMYCYSGIRCEFCSNSSCLWKPEVVSQHTALASEHLPLIWSSTALVLLSKAASFHPRSYLSSSRKIRSNLAQCYGSLHPCCHTEVKPISLQRNISFNLNHPSSQALKESWWGNVCVCRGCCWECGLERSQSFMGLSSWHINFLPVGLLFTYLLLLFYSWNSTANLSKVNRPVQKVQETAWLQPMNFNALHYSKRAVFILDSSPQSAVFQ